MNATVPHILLIEDDKMFSDILKKRFEAGGITITHAAGGNEALAIVQKEAAFDLILLDVALPDMDGFEILTRMRKVPTFAKIPVIVVSNFVKEKDLEWGKELGVVHFVQKSSVMPGEIIDMALNVCAKKS